MRPRCRPDGDGAMGRARPNAALASASTTSHTGVTKVAEFISDDEARDRRLEAIRARRGSPERMAQIQALQMAKAKESPKKGPSSGSGRKTPENSSAFFGHPWSLWFAMRDAGYEHIIERARDRKTTTYGELWVAVTAKLGEDLGNPWRQIDHLLGSIGEVAYDKDGLMPTALVMYEGTGETNPGPGFFRLAANMGLFPGGDAPPVGEEWNEMTARQRTFWEDQRELVFAHAASK